MIKTEYGEILTRLESDFLEYFETIGVDPSGDRVAISKFYGAFRYVNRVTLGGRKLNPRQASESDAVLITTLCGFYTDVILQYNVISSLYGLSLLLNIDKRVIDSFIDDNKGVVVENTYKAGTPDVNVLMIDAVRGCATLYQEMAISNLNADRTGLVVNANNNRALGLEYERKRATESVAVKTAVSLAELPKLTEL